jgi:hypothetical protein
VRRIAALIASACVVAACGDVDPPVCHEGMPLSSSLRADPAFGAFKYHMHHQARPLRPVPCEIWADGKFEYNAALEYALVPQKDPKGPGDECANALALRFSYPGRDIDRQRLKVFSQAVAPAAGLDGASLESALRQVIASGDKYRPRDLGGKARIRAGKLFHATRGEFFLVTLTWPRPDGAPDTTE